MWLRMATACRRNSSTSVSILSNYMYSERPWFALQTKPKSERKVERLLVQKGYDCFTPTYRSKRKWSDRTVELDLPLFPGYVFCRFNRLVLGKAISTQGVTRVVGFGGTPAEVDREEVEALQLLSQSKFFREPWKYLPDGTLVLIETGPLTGIQGIISFDGNQRRLVISVTLLQRSVAIPLAEDTVISVIEDLKESRIRFNSESILAVKLLRKT
jgi:transcription antitermination factor NusG